MSNEQPNIAAPARVDNALYERHLLIDKVVALAGASAHERRAPSTTSTILLKRCLRKCWCPRSTERRSESKVDGPAAPR